MKRMSDMKHDGKLDPGSVVSKLQRETSEPEEMKREGGIIFV